MAQNNTRVKALVLAGGGARGSYQVGVWRALTGAGLAARRSLPVPALAA
ncbi:MAG: hypothetical protein ACLVJH_04540 [Faecalibacterium prausnitzii]